MLFAPSWFHSSASAEEPFFKKGDVIALVGGEDMVAMSEYGYLELLLTRALPGHRLKFRSLAWEGDTVFEQRRDLNFPTWEQQLDQIGATVVICQFGQMESLAGKEKLPEFVAAYEKLIGRFSGGGKRRFAVVGPSALLQVAKDFDGNEILTCDSRLEAFESGVMQIAKRQGIPFLSVKKSLISSQAPICLVATPTPVEEAAFKLIGDTWRASLHNASAHLSETAHRLLAER